MTRCACLLTIAVLLCGAAYAQDPAGSNQGPLQSYEQLIGTWTYEGTLLENLPPFAEQGSKLTMSANWDWILDKKAVEYSFQIAFEGGGKITGKSLIGWDAAERRLVAGGLTSTGTAGLGVITYDEASKTWMDKGSGVDGEGKPFSSTLVVTLVARDTIEIQVKDRTGGDVTGDSPKYTFKRGGTTRRPVPATQAIDN